MGKQINYRQVFARNAQINEQLMKVCPEMNERSGIYFFHRIDEDGKKYGYLGLARNIKQRTISHIQGYQQHIDISLKKRGFWNENNPYGWKLSLKNYPENEIEAQERRLIKYFSDEGYEMYNIESGGREGKTMINERKPSKTYVDGIKQGKNSLRKELNHIIDNYLFISLKKDNKLGKKALEKFKNLLKYD